MAPEGGFSATACSPSETIMNIFCIYARFNRWLCGFNSLAFARPCDMDSVLTGQFVRRLGVGASYKCSPGYPFHFHQLPPPHDIGLTPHFKTLQSPIGSVLLWFKSNEVYPPPIRSRV